MNIKDSSILVSENKKYLVKDIVHKGKKLYVVMDYEGADIILYKGDSLSVNWEFKIKMEQ